MMIIDAQVHVWKAEAPNRPWPEWGKKVSHLEEPLNYQRMIGLMNDAGIDRAIIVPPSWEGDRIDYGMEAAQKHPGRFAVMGRIPFADRESATLLPRWRDQPGMLGIRVSFAHGGENWMRDGTIDWFWPAAEEAGIPVMIHPPNLIPFVAKVAERHPALTLIIDHFGLSQNIKRAGGIPEAITQTITLARYPNVYVKTTSAPTFSSEGYPFRDMYPHIRRVIEAFGPQRCFWGTDLTISFEKCSYRQRVTHFLEELDFLSADDKIWIMGRALLECLGWPGSTEVTRSGLSAPPGS
jgi:predicted TIM-barrel fold metal-dependent hydrolase